MIYNHKKKIPRKIKKVLKHSNVNENFLTPFNEGMDYAYYDALEIFEFYKHWGADGRPHKFYKYPYTRWVAKVFAKARYQIKVTSIPL